MSREVRMVPENWKHPKNENGSYIALFDGNFEQAAKNWDEEYKKWQTTPESDCTYTEWAGGRPNPDDYMPEWREEQKTHLMMYETCSEGTPISPAFKTPEELARWLADNEASAFGSMTATYEQWLNTCTRGWAVSAVANSKGLQSGVAALSEK